MIGEVRNTLLGKKVRLEYVKEETYYIWEKVKKKDCILAKSLINL